MPCAVPDEWVDDPCLALRFNVTVDHFISDQRYVGGSRKKTSVGLVDRGGWDGDL